MFMHYTDIAIFVFGHFILTRPVKWLNVPDWIDFDMAVFYSVFTGNVPSV